MLCEICWHMLRGQHGRIRGPSNPRFRHHESAESLWHSVSVNCSICRVLGDELLSRFIRIHESAFSRAHSLVRQQTTAQLSLVPMTGAPGGAVYRLDMTVEWLDAVAHFEKFKKTFVLKPFEEHLGTVGAGFPMSTPFSRSMYDNEVFQLARHWINNCDKKHRCFSQAANTPRKYPTRLIDLSDLRKTIPESGVLGQDKVLNKAVRLVETSAMAIASTENNLYVTLSHKWGTAHVPLRLTTERMAMFQQGIGLKSLSPVFRDAIQFALRLPKIGYIWIDSLCIIQDDKQDWQRESVLMYEVYGNSYLNISATSGANGEVGLYSERNPQDLWGDVVSLNVDDMPSIQLSSPTDGSSARTRQGPQLSSASRDARDSGHKASTIRMCHLVDISSWETSVDQAPLNQRAWVFQERLMAPRVLHFSQGRIAWECFESDAMEGWPYEIPTYQLMDDELYEGIPFKRLLDPSPERHHPGPQSSRYTAMVPHGHSGHRPRGLAPAARSLEKINYYVIWARIVEIYSRTNLTRPKDKLIALSGVASKISQAFRPNGKPARYVAGLWDWDFTSQLLWKVEPVFHGRGDSAQVGMLEYRSTRPPKYRAPSFSWASVDAQHGQGIIYGPLLEEKDVLVDIEPDDVDAKQPPVALVPPQEEANRNMFVKLATKEHEFGIVERGHIRLWGKISKARLRRMEAGNFYWLLEDRNSAWTGPHTESKTSTPVPELVNEEPHYNVYLDAPDDDNQDNRLMDSDKTYCLPVGYRPGPAHSTKPDSRDLMCLLLQYAGDDEKVKDWDYTHRKAVFSRIGMTILSPVFDVMARESVLKKMDGDNFLPHQGQHYDPDTGKGLICII